MLKMDKQKSRYQSRERLDPIRGTGRSSKKQYKRTNRRIFADFDQREPNFRAYLLYQGLEPSEYYENWLTQQI